MPMTSMQRLMSNWPPWNVMAIIRTPITIQETMSQTNFFYRGAAAMAVEQRMLGQDQADPGPNEQPHLNPLFMVPNVPKTFMDVEPLIKVQENHVRRKPPLGARHHLQT